MKIAYICHHSRPNYEFEWFDTIPGDDVVFITSDESSTKKSSKYIKVNYLEEGWENRFFASTARRVKYTDFKSSINDVDIVVVLEVFSSLSRQFVEYCKQIGKPVVVLVYELINSHPIYKIPSYRTNTKYCIENADHFIAVSEAAADHLKHLGARKEKVTVVYPGVNRNVFKPNYENRKDASIIFVGKLEKHKGIDMALRAFEKVSAKHPDATMSVIGTGSFSDQVEEFCTNNPAVTYHNFVENHKLPSHLNAHTVYILPARETKKLGFLIGAEQFGFSVVEAMSCGLPVIVSDVGALPEIVTERNPIFKKGNTEALTEKILGILEDKQSTKELGKLNARKAAESYDLNTQAKRLSDVLKKVAKEYNH